MKEFFLYLESDYILFKVRSHNDTVYGDFFEIYDMFEGIMSNCTQYGYSYHSPTEKSPLREYLDYPEYVVDWENGLPHTDDNRWFRYISFGGCCYHADVHCKAIRGSKTLVHILNLLTENDNKIVKGYFNYFSNEFDFVSRETRTHKYRPCKLCKTEEFEVPEWFLAYGVIWQFIKTLTEFKDTITKKDPSYFMTCEDGLTYEQRCFIEKLKRDRGSNGNT